MDLLGGRSKNAGQAAAVKAWVRGCLAQPDEVTVMVTELTCTEPGCPPLETVIALLREGSPTVQYKLHKAMAEVTPDDVATALGRSG